MTTQEFENQLSELIKQAPKEATFFMVYTAGKNHDIETHIQGTARNLSLNLAVSANKSTDVKRIIMQAINISNTPD